jgi:hypothetical protein
VARLCGVGACLGWRLRAGGALPTGGHTVVARSETPAEWLASALRLLVL